jgi:hypothetical protein
MKKFIVFALLTLVVTACSKKDDKNDNPLVGTTWTGALLKVSGDFNGNGINESLRIDVTIKFDKTEYTGTTKITTTEGSNTSTEIEEGKGKYDYDEPFVTLYDNTDEEDVVTAEIDQDKLILPLYELGLQITLTKK